MNDGQVRFDEEDASQTSKISRRKLLASMGMAGAAAVMLGAMPGIAVGKNGDSVTDAVYDVDQGMKTKPKDLTNLDFVIATTLAELRAQTEPQVEYVYLVTDIGQEGHFAYDPTDTTLADNTGTIVVSASGARFKRLLESSYIHVTWFGAKGDGVTDDMAAIQKAIDTAFSLGGGTVFFPRGTYIVSPFTSTRIMLRNDVNLLGEGTKSVIKVKDNAGDYGMIFGANSSTPLKNVRISNLRVDQNPQNNTTCNISSSRTDSYFWQFVVALYNYENIVIDNVAFDPTCGVNTITLNKITAKNAVISNCRFNFVMAKGDGGYDNSAIYVNGRSHTVSNCLFYAEPGQKARGAIETHTGTSVISGNVSDGYYTGINLQSSETSGDHSDMTVTNNTITNANQGIQFGPRLLNPIKNVVISNNTIHLINSVHQRNLTTGISTAGGTIESAPFENITITGNTIVFQEELTRRTTLNESAYGIGFYKECDYTNILISNNIIKNAPVTGIRIGSTSKVGISTNIQITGNVIVNAGHYPTITGNTILFEEELTRRSSLNEAAFGIGLFKECDYKNILISNNVIKNAPVSGIRIGSTTKVGTSTNIQITGNMIVNAGHYPSLSELYRAAILLRSTVKGASISGNFISDTYESVQGLFSIRVNDFDGTFTDVSVTNNLITTKQGGLWFSLSPSVTTDAPLVKTAPSYPPPSGTFNQGEIVLITSLGVTAGETPVGYKVTATGTSER